MSANNASKLPDLRPGGGLRPGGSVQRKKSDDNVCQNKLQLVGGREIMDSREQKSRIIKKMVGQEIE